MVFEMPKGHNSQSGVSYWETEDNATDIFEAFASGKPVVLHLHGEEGDMEAYIRMTGCSASLGDYGAVAIPFPENNICDVENGDTFDSLDSLYVTSENKIRITEWSGLMWGGD